MFPFDHPATVAIWLLIATACGWLYGGHVARQVGGDPQRYRERWGYRPRTSLVAVTVVLLSSLVPLIGQSNRQLAASRAALRASRSPAPNTTRFRVAT